MRLMSSSAGSRTLGDVEAGTLLWEPRPDARATSRLGRFFDRVAEAHDLDLPDFAAGHRWSVTDLDGFWREVAAEFDVCFHDEPETFLAEEAMPGAVWCPGATLNLR